MKRCPMLREFKTRRAEQEDEMRTFTHVMPGLLVLFLAAGCSAGTADRAHSAGERTSRETPVAAVEENAFAWDLYGQLRKTEGNLFFSPFGIAAALAMAYAGAGGDTAREMGKTLHFADDEARVHQWFEQRIREWTGGKSSTGTIQIANRLWVQREYKLLDGFLTPLKRYYGAGVQPLDFSGAAEDARKQINMWTEQETQGKVTELLKPGVIHPLTRLLLTNAMYFKGKWRHPFEQTATMRMPFQLGTGVSAEIPMMQQEGAYPYFEDETLQVLALPYEGGTLEMMVLLPRQYNGIDAAEQALTSGKYAQYLGARAPQTVRVFLPRFNAAAAFSLAKTLTAMGMPGAFDAHRADFSPMTGHRDVYIDAVEHKACVEVTEEGTEAAAATAVAIRTKSAAPGPPPKVFRADHPFVFVIRDISSEGILFLGRLTDPRAAA